ncbi:tetratricopeptide repeat protein [Klebsiella pneumoniae]|uniref:tetratricopeptide repeat protein n=1 Tax=Klebsiella pneumoniae TaxID=573 RepID=UPI0009BABE9A|nr:tetratricopeptide repeat protein [Klebsiella pneumoniae]EIX9177991.1 tetratricopeptide repeat protein [Klebsiella pneumoniae]MCJ6259505.1 tetratricopeptide repeat protein [Klebsiella pneumoniae]UVG12331.1 tetratricopeptide repeat protein [Klebsiella pneumoniae]UVG17306.1 tetratricopeptide repeat protein [Klebsiella pneumoniae]SLX17737.1 Predicted O-linked N-acetylglucosamine transferase, SPINDLY family [Klebsiella pneumoniae]
MKGVIKLSLLALSISFSFVGYAESKSVEVLSAVVKDQKIPGAQVVIQRNGEQSISSLSDDSGNAQIGNNASDTNGSLIIIKKSGYSTLVAKCPCSGMSYALSPTMKGLDSMRVVLGWGSSPTDLDSHMVYPGNHIFFNHKLGDNGNLDVDDTDSFGPETITLTRRENGKPYIYAVHDFSDKHEPETNNLSRSDAKVFVYIGDSLVRTYYVPKDQSGNLWTVFKINENGAIEDINSIKGVSVYGGDIDNVLSTLLKSNATLPHQNWDAEQINISNMLNLKGEESYRREQYEEAISLFTNSINNYSENGKAYGNLGLVYQKVGRTAEAIWANRKAIVLASGKNASTIRAGANYNIGKIYEGEGQYNEALNYYKAAKNEKQNPVYDNAILRVSSKVN